LQFVLEGGLCQVHILGETKDKITECISSTELPDSIFDAAISALLHDMYGFSFFAVLVCMWNVLQMSLFNSFKESHQIKRRIERFANSVIFVKIKHLVLLRVSLLRWVGPLEEEEKSGAYHACCPVSNTTTCHLPLVLRFFIRCAINKLIIINNE
jgi:hypothetical protein